MSKNFPLYEMFPGTKKIPRVEICDLPTPIHKLEKVSQELDVPNIWIKRDDLTSPLYGGNKPRKYEFIIADAIKKGKIHICTIGGIGSNHALANTIFAQKFGLESHIYLVDQPLIPHVRHNLLCDFAYGAYFHYCKTVPKLVLKLLYKLITDRKAYLLMPGASVPLGTIGFVNAALELAKDIKEGRIPEPDHLFVAVGSSGTCAGLTLGLELAGLKTKVHGIAVAMEFSTNKKKVLSLAKKTLSLLRKYDSSIPSISLQKLSERLELTYRFYGGEYGKVTEEGLEAIKLIAKDDIHLSTTYTGKAFSGLVSYCREYHDKAKNEVILFWNTFNSHDLSEIWKNVDYHALPAKLHKFFDGTVPIDEDVVKANEVYEKKKSRFNKYETF